MEVQINLIKVIDALLAKKWIIIFVGALAMALAFYFVSGNAPDMYTAYSSIYAASNESYRDSVEAMNVMRDYVDVIKSRKVAERASSYLAREVSAEEIAGTVSASYSVDSKIITLSAASADPETAIAVANAVAEAFIQEMVSITAVDSIKVLDSADTAAKTLDTSRQAWLIRLGVVVAVVLLSSGSVALVAAVDTRAAHPQEATLNGKIELLGVIPGKDI